MCFSCSWSNPGVAHMTAQTRGKLQAAGLEYPSLQYLPLQWWLWRRGQGAACSKSCLEYLQGWQSTVRLECAQSPHCHCNPAMKQHYSHERPIRITWTTQKPVFWLGTVSYALSMEYFRQARSIRQLYPFEHKFHLMKRRLESETPQYKKQLNMAAVKAWQSIWNEDTKSCQWVAGSCS